MRRSIRKKIFLFVIPASVVLVVLMVAVMLPHGSVSGDVGQVKEGLAEVLAAEDFARYYERMLKECAAYIATGNEGHFELFEEAQQLAEARIESWIGAEEMHTGDTPEEHEEELETLEEMKRYYLEIVSSLDAAIAAGRVDRAAGMAALETLENSPAGSAINEGLDEMLPEEEEQLVKYLDILYGAVNSLAIPRMLGLQHNVESIKSHIGVSFATERFARNYQAQLKNALQFALLGGANREQLLENRNTATDSLNSWRELDILLTGNSSVTPALADMSNRYSSTNAAIDEAIAAANAGDPTGAVAVVENRTGSASQVEFRSAIESEIKKQTTALEVDTSEILRSSTNTAWGIGIVFLLLVIGGATGIVLLSRTIVRPVLQLRDAASRFGAGETDVSVDVRSRDELGQLGESFNEMAIARAEAERKLAEARDELEQRVKERTLELEQSEKRYRVLANTLPQAVFEIDQKGMLSYANESGLKMFGYSEEDLNKTAALDVIDPSDHERVAGAIMKIMDGTSTGAVREYTARRKDGSTFPAIVYTTLIADNEGNPAGIRGILVDITDRKESEKALQAEQEFTETIINSLNDIFYVLGVQGGGLLIRWNRAFREVSGYSDAELAKMTVFDFFDPEGQAEQEKFLQKLMTEGNAEIEGDAKVKDGRRIPYYFNSTLVTDETGVPLYVTGVGRDVSEKRQAEQKLRLAKFEVDNAMDIVIRATPDGKIAFANDAAAAAHGYERPEMLGLHLWDISINFAEAQWPEILETIKQIETMRLETVAVHREGYTFPMDSTINYFWFEGEEHVVIFGRDITERRLAELRQERLNEELLAINKELNDFAYVVSHDLKAPLRGIGSLANWLYVDYADKLEEEGRKQLELLLDRAKRMESLIESVLQYSRIGRIRETRESVDLNDLVIEAIEMVSPPEEIGVRVEGVLPSVTVERTRMSQVFTNLIGNAVKFMDKQEGEVTISCEREDAKFWRVAVADNGPGIDERYFEKIFQIFQTLVPQDDIESTGLGLTLVKKIVEMNGGRIWVESKLGEGSTFYFTIPVHGPPEGGEEW